MEFLRQYIEDQINIDDNDWQKVEALFTRVAYSKGQELFVAGEVCDKIYYVSEGIARIYSIDLEGKEKTFAVNYNQEGYQLDPFSGDYVSYLTQSESQFFCEALVDSTVYVANFSALDRLYESELKWMTFARKISDMQLITIVQRMQMLKPLDATAKYKLLKEIAPVYEKVLSNAQFASVLGIAPQSLSRVKGKLEIGIRGDVNANI